MLQTIEDEYVVFSVSHIFVILGFLLAFILIVNILNDRHTPSGMSAWILLIVFLPYIGVPLYLIFHGRKLRQVIDTKDTLKLIATDISAPEGAHLLDKLVRSYQIPGACRNNSITYITSAEDTFSTLLRLITDAKYSINITTYVFKADEVGKVIIKILTERAEEGVQVKLLIDRFGSLMLRRGVFDDLISVGGAVELFMPLVRLPIRGRTNLRNHRKMAIFDGKIVWTGGANIAKEYMGPTPCVKRWTDLSFVLKGPAVELYNDIFRSDWKFASRDHIQYEPESFKQRQQDVIEEDGQQLVQVVPSGPDVVGDPLYHVVISAVFAARSKIAIVSPYFVPDALLMEALIIAVRRGVDITILIPRRSNHLIADIARITYLLDLAELGVTILCFDSGMLHAKAMMIDDDVAIVGSANIDPRSMLLNFEVATIIYKSSSIQTLDQWIQSIKSRSRELNTDINSVLLFVSNVARLIAPVL